MNSSSISSSLTSWFSQLSKPQEKAEDETKTDGEKTEEEKDDAKKELTEETSAEAGAPANEKDLIPSEVQKKVAEETQKLMNSAYSFGNYLFEVASETGKKVSSNLNETASNLKKTVENKTILGDLNREQDEFIRTKREKQGDGAVPAWCGYQEEDVMKEQILALSTDARNFLRSPPDGVQFQFEFDHYFPVAQATLKEDANLRQMRFKLVPTKVKEETFWRNYFYRVSLIKQSAQLSTLAETSQQNKSSDTSSCSSSIVVVGSTATGTIPNSKSSSPSIKEDDVMTDNVDATDDIGAAEFESDAFESAASLNPEDLEREMRELGMSDGDGSIPNSSESWDVPVWEKEIQKALQAYEVVSEDKDESWDQEIEEMLTAEEEQAEQKQDQKA